MKVPNDCKKKKKNKVQKHPYRQYKNARKTCSKKRKTINYFKIRLKKQEILYIRN